MVSILCAAGCGHTHTRSSSTSTARATPAAQELSDAQVAKVLDTLNRGEVRQAEIALEKAQSPLVRSFATHMAEAHETAMVKNQALAQQLGLEATESTVDEHLALAGQMTMDDLQNASREDFDRRYIRSQVDAHREALTLIDQVLLPSAEAPSLRAEIERVRPVIASHLDHALTLEREVARTPALSAR